MTIQIPEQWWAGTPITSLDRVVMAALDRVGEMEDFPFTNRSAFVDAINLAAGTDKAEPWCASFVTYCVSEAKLNSPPKDKAACEEWHVWAVVTKRFHDASETPKPGWIAVFDFRHTGKAHHCGIVIRINGPAILTCEGNTDEDGSAEGNGVYVKDRRGKGLLGYIDPS